MLIFAADGAIAAVCGNFCCLLAARGYAVCLLLGAVLGVGIMKTTGARLAKIQDAYAGKEVTFTAEVESTGRAYTAGRVSAVLMVEKVDGKAVHFRVECASLPKCEAGGRIRGRFSLDVPDATQRLDDYADGIVLSAEYLSGMLRLGQSESFRARTARLQAALSRALRKGTAENTGGVLAAMVVGDRSHLTSTLRSAYRGAGLSHVLVVSGLHVTIFCGLLDALPHKERERSRAYRRARSLLRAGPSAGGHHRRDALCPPGGGGGLGQLPRRLGGRPGGYAHLAGRGRRPYVSGQRVCGL